VRALVDKQTELSSTQDARYLDKLRDEVSETMVFGEATRTQIVPPDDQGVVGAEGASGSYKVKPGDSLWKIAQDRYGDGYKWRRIYEANRDSLKDIDVLRIGQILTLPMP
jgi:nucleoid-associated protein YgaU